MGGAALGRLYEAAAEPKQLKWYESGHLLPAEAYEEAAEWVGKTWAAVTKGAAAGKAE